MLSHAKVCAACACRAAPLPSIAQWVSGIMGGIDLAPSDITCALVLAAAAQQRRRRMRIKRALDPVLERATTDMSSTLSKSSRSVRPTDMDSDIEDDTGGVLCPSYRCIE